MHTVKQQRDASVVWSIVYSLAFLQCRDAFIFTPIWPHQSGAPSQCADVDTPAGADGRQPGQLRGPHGAGGPEGRHQAC
eukprot:scaffold271730_cov47-Prasinocladus_malaysianus.AAC.1